MSASVFIKLFEKISAEAKKTGKTDSADALKMAISAPTKGVKRALLIGINYFGTTSELRGCCMGKNSRYGENQRT